MTYEETRDAMVSKEAVKAEIKLHHALFTEFLAEHGDHVEYNARTVLNWLGY